MEGIEELAGRVLLHVQTAAIAVDDGGRLGVYNRAAERVLGVPVADVLGRSLEDLAGGPPALAALAGVLRAARRSGKAARRHKVVVHTPEGQRVLGYTLSILGDGALALFFADITDPLEDERRTAEARRFAEVGKIAGAMAHELKQPLATVELYTNLLRRRLKDEPEALAWLDVIRDQTRLSLERISAIMHSMNPDAAGASGVVLTPLLPVVRHAAGVARSRFEGSVVRLHLGSGEPVVALPESDLRSVLGNLIVNALQVTGGRGPVDVTVRPDGDRVHVRVADRGPGLPDADIFAAFYTTKASGTGLGLWLVRRLVEQAGGTISASARRGGGAVFAVDLPLPSRERLRGAQVLVVEDDARLRAATAAVLGEHGARVTAVGAGKDVPDGARGWDCGILDYHLPDMRGTQVAARLAGDVPVLLVSGDPAAGAALAGLRDRRAWYLPKPFEVETYLDLVSLLVG